MSFFFIFTTLLILVYAYTGLRLIPSLLSSKAAVAGWCLLSAAFLTLIVHLYFRINDLMPGVSYLLAWTGYTGLGLVSVLFCLVIVRDGLLLPLWVTQIVAHSGSVEKKKATARRRAFLVKASGCAVAAAGAGVTGLGLFRALEPPRVVRVNIPVSKHLSGLKGLQILQFTDLHVGPTIRYNYVQSVCDIIHQVRADIIVLTGDLVDGSPESLADDVAPLKELQAPLGKYFVTGNHEYYSGVMRWIAQMKTLGFDVLLNEHRVIPYNNALLTLAGVTDIKAGRFDQGHRSDPGKAINGSPENSFKLLCAHHPASIYQAAPAGFDLQISGHTHGGQYFPFNYFVLLEHPFVKGMYLYGDTQLYVSQGTGYWGPPLRLGTFPEITVFQFI